MLGSDVGSTEDYLYVPAGYRAENPSPLVLLLHGAGEDARGAGGSTLVGQSGLKTAVDARPYADQTLEG